MLALLKICNTKLVNANTLLIFIICSWSIFMLVHKFIFEVHATIFIAVTLFLQAHEACEDIKYIFITLMNGNLVGPRWVVCSQHQGNWVFVLVFCLQQSKLHQGKKTELQWWQLSHWWPGSIAWSRSRCWLGNDYLKCCSFLEHRTPCLNNSGNRLPL